MRQERRITVKVTEQLHKAVRVRVAEEGRAISDVVRELLEAWLQGKVDLPPAGESPQEEDST